MRGHDGNLTHEKENIAEMFATFHEDLYASRNGDHGAATYSRDCTQAVAPFMGEELQAFLKLMSIGNAADSLCITAEMLKVNCGLLSDILLEVFNDTLWGHELPPNWVTAK